MRRTHCVAIVVLVSFLVCANGFAGGYLKYDDVNGESTDKEHQGWIDVLAWSWGVEKQVGHVGDRTECSRAYLKELVITKAVDSTSPVLVDLAETCNFARKVTLEVELESAPSSKPSVPRVMLIELQEVTVSKVDMGSSDPDDIPTESLTLNFSEATVTVVEAGGTR